MALPSDTSPWVQGKLSAALLGVGLELDHGQLVPPIWDFTSMLRNVNGTYTWRMKDGSTVEFDITGRQAAMADRSGNRTTYHYDALGRLITIIDPVGTQGNPALATTTLAYGSAGYLSTIVDPAGRVTQLHHTMGRLEKIVDPDNSERHFGYGLMDAMVSQTGKNGFVTTYAVNRLGRVTSVTRSDGSTNLVASANTGILADSTTGSGTSASPIAAKSSSEIGSSYRDGRGLTTRLRTDRMGRIKESVDPLGVVRQVDRDGRGLVLRRAEPNGAVTTFQYDDRGNTLVMNEEGANGPSGDDRRWAYTYEPQYNNLTSVVDPRGHDDASLLNSAGATQTIATNIQTGMFGTAQHWLFLLLRVDYFRRLLHILRQHVTTPRLVIMVRSYFISARWCVWILMMCLGNSGWQIDWQKMVAMKMLCYTLRRLKPLQFL